MRKLVQTAWLVDLFLVALTASGQGDKGTIAGNVKDPVGGIAANISVQATNTATGTAYKATSSKEGAYAIADLPAGTYDVSATLAGGAPFGVKSVAVSAGNIARVDVNFKEGSQLSTLGEDASAFAADVKRHNPPAGATPRTAEGKPDLSGVARVPAVRY